MLVLLIGGPKDGERLAVPDGSVGPLVVHETKDKKSVSGFVYQDQVEFISHRYHPVKMWRLYDILWKYEGLSDDEVLCCLIDGYTPKKG